MTNQKSNKDHKIIVCTTSLLVRKLDSNYVRKLDSRGVEIPRGPDSRNRDLQGTFSFVCLNPGVGFGGFCPKPVYRVINITIFRGVFRSAIGFSFDLDSRWYNICKFTVLVKILRGTFVCVCVCDIIRQ